MEASWRHSPLTLWDLAVCNLHVMVWVGGQGVRSYFFYFLFCFCDVVNCSFMAGT